MQLSSRRRRRIESLQGFMRLTPAVFIEVLFQLFLDPIF
jgi:hypothetical protein